MARPLTKCSELGELYKRPAKIEALIDASIRASPSELLARCKNLDHSSLEYFPSECLVHLIRDAGRRQDENLMNDLVPILLARCEQHVRSKHGRRSYTDDLCDDVVGGMGELFAMSWGKDQSDQLDYFEIHFNASLQTFAIDCYRKIKRRNKRFIQQPDVTDDSGKKSSIEPSTDVPSALDRLLKSELSADLWNAINDLPEEQRSALVLHHLEGYDIESKDTNKTTVATLLNVTGRTVFNYLKHAAKALSRFTEEQ